MTPVQPLSLLTIKRSFYWVRLLIMESVSVCYRLPDMVLKIILMVAGFGTIAPMPVLIGAGENNGWLLRTVKS
jgi:hypothetical protein